MEMGDKRRLNNQPSTGMAQAGGGWRGDEGIEYRTLGGDDEIGRRTTMQVPTNDWSGKGGESRRR
jgi:hypothetical protein